jgi:hypothetical protein
MLKITCFKCHWGWSMNNEAVHGALTSMQPEEEYYAVECPKCRRVNKITIHQLERALPRPAAGNEHTEE